MEGDCVSEWACHFLDDDEFEVAVEEASDDSIGRVSDVGLDEEIRVIRGFPRVDVRVWRGRALEWHGSFLVETADDV